MYIILVRGFISTRYPLIYVSWEHAIGTSNKV